MVLKETTFYQPTQMTSLPVLACLLDPRFKHLQFPSERISDLARDHLHQLLQDEKNQHPAPDPRSLLQLLLQVTSVA